MGKEGLAWKPALTEPCPPLEELRANTRGAGEGFPSPQRSATSSQPHKQSTGWHQPSHSTHFHWGSVSAAKALSQLGTTVAKAPTLPTPEELRGAKGERGTISSLSHIIFWGVQGPSPLYRSPYIRSTSSLPRKRPKVGEPRVAVQAVVAGAVPGITETQDKEFA